MNTQQINALKRLQRAGDPESVTNEKLRAATQTLVDYIIEIVPHEEATTELPRGYTIERLLPSPDGSPRFGLFTPGLIGSGMHGRSDLVIIHRFAAAVAAGLIEEIEAQYQPSITPGGVFL